jgi:hypothetical protein
MQVNVTVDLYWHQVLRLLAARDQCSAPELLRPVIESWLAGQLEGDDDLSLAVEALDRSRSRAQKKADRRRGLADVAPLAPRKPRTDPQSKMDHSDS